MQDLLQFAGGVWISYGDELITYALWAMVGYAILLPALFTQAVYNTIKVGNFYDIRGHYRREHSRLKRDSKFYGLATLAILLQLVSLALI
jgi:hypothetical protein